MNDFLFGSGCFLLGVAVMGFLNEKRLRRMEEEVRAHVGTEDKLRRYGA